ncbi:hypothetical protein PFLUV_G00152110 [Perca fluviatilis]|uniref:Uncharacterized protein n=1 Tax=Perca fluviatilis TaxID=8168 RepID=A0A6A5F2C5_PERFL|nr:hypothetical protein PFLUV_G00152110 [Perca fluviatilis]
MVQPLQLRGTCMWTPKHAGAVKDLPSVYKPWPDVCPVSRSQLSTQLEANAASGLLTIYYTSRRRSNNEAPRRVNYCKDQVRRWVNKDHRLNVAAASSGSSEH